MISFISWSVHIVKNQRDITHPCFIPFWVWNHLVNIHWLQILYLLYFTLLIDHMLFRKRLLTYFTTLQFKPIYFIICFLWITKSTVNFLTFINFAVTTKKQNFDLYNPYLTLHLPDFCSFSPYASPTHNNLW